MLVSTSSYEAYPRTEMIEDAITCPIFTEHYTERGERVPRILPCGHTFCSSCESRFADHKCPDCRRPFGSINNLPRNFNALHLLARAEAPPPPTPAPPAPTADEITELSMWLRD